MGRSSSSSSVLLELVHRGHAPAALLMQEPDAILLIGLIVARELGLAIPPALQLPLADMRAIATRRVRIAADGEIT